MTWSWPETSPCIGSLIAGAVVRAPGTRGRVSIVADQVNMVDRLILRVEDTRVRTDDVRRPVLAVYPALVAAMDSGSLILEIEAGVDLGRQIKALAIRDVRSNGGA